MKRISLTLLIISVFISVIAQTKKPVAKKPASKANAASAAVSPAVMERGKVVYNTYCVACHQPDGGGVPSMNAPIVKTPHVLGAKPALIDIILKGMQGVDILGESYSNVMPAHNFLTNQQIADVLTYVRNNFGNKASGVTAAEVAAVRNKK
ncbi:c-type cytochrome [Paradesertivirga mongoliensis]|uniref:C-type cytochrome n=1 Tax=Paradesertivirga mongoliensis TaxID=2100740 RepID=A0ABW4ZI12_9SPHI